MAAEAELKTLRGTIKDYLTPPNYGNGRMLEQHKPAGLADGRREYKPLDGRGL